MPEINWRSCGPDLGLNLKRRIVQLQNCQGWSSFKVFFYNISGNIYCMPGCIIGPHWVSVTIRSPLIHGLIEHSRTLWNTSSQLICLIGSSVRRGKGFNKWWHLFIAIKEEMRLVSLFLVFETTSSRWSQNIKMWFGKVVNHLADNWGESFHDLRWREIF